MLNKAAFNFRSLSLYKAVYEEGSFSLVARKNGLSVSLISRTIINLEAAIEKQLFSRNTRSLVPTSEGHFFYHFACSSLAVFEDFEQKSDEVFSEPSGLVRINTPLIFGRKHVAPWLKGLLEKYPKMQIELNQTDEFIDPHKDQVDLCFRITSLEDSTMHSRKICAQRYYLAASPDYILENGEISNPADLKKHRCLVYSGPEGKQKWHYRFNSGQWARYEFQEAMISNNGDSLLTASLSGVGIILFPDWLVSEHINDGSLIEILPEVESAIKTKTHYVSILYPNRKFHSWNVRAVIEYFSTLYGELPYWKKS